MKDVNRIVSYGGRPSRGLARLFLRGSLAFLLLTSLLAGSLWLAACGGDSGDDSREPSTQQPATPSGQSGTQAPTTQATATPAPAGGALTPSGTFTEDDLVLPQGWWNVDVPLVLGDRVVVTYTSAPKAVGGFGESGSAGRPGVVFNVNDPIGDSIYRGEQVADGGAEFTAELNGIYQLTFFNPVVRNLQEVIVEYQINP